MAILQKPLAAFALGLIIIAGIASPSYARAISAARAAAIHECSVRASQYSEYTYGNRDIDTYRACMAEHGQPE